MNILFDLDNTLYDAEQYFSGAFREISTYLEKNYDISRKEAYNVLMKTWKTKTSMYSQLFNDSLNSLNLKMEAGALVKIFNNYAGKLVPYPEILLLLKELKKRKFKLGIITDGDVERQKRKIELLGIKDFFDVIICTKEIETNKLSEIPFKKALDELAGTTDDSFYIGDNPYLDFEGAKKIGIKTIRLLQGEFKNLPKTEYIDYEINELKDLINIIEKTKN